MMNDEHKSTKYKVSDKAVLRAYVSKEIYDQIRDLAWAKYGRFRGALSYEVEQALRVWLATHTQNAHKLLNAANPQPKVARVFNQVKKFLEENLGYVAIIPGQQIPRKHIMMAIANVRGPDDRTVKKWFDAFLANKLIKMITPELYEVL
jgi:hypothetical protein